MNKNIEKTWPLWVLIATAGCPACFPAIAGIASSMGITFLQWYGMIMAKIALVFIVISMLLAYLSYKRNKFKATFYLTEFAWSIMLISYFIGFIVVYYIFLIILIGSSVWNFFIDRKLKSCIDGQCKNK